MEKQGFTKQELKAIRSLNSPTKMQSFIDNLDYNKGRRISIADVLRKKKADCLEAALFACMAFRMNGFKAFIMDLESYTDDDHVICVYKQKGYFGAVAQSKYLGLRYKSPVYRSLRELSMAYFDNFFDFDGILDLRRRSLPVYTPLKISRWAFTSRYSYDIEERLRKIRHIQLFPKTITLPKISPFIYEKHTLMIPKGHKVGKEYREVLKRIKKI